MDRCVVSRRYPSLIAPGYAINTIESALKMIQIEANLDGAKLDLEMLVDRSVIIPIIIEPDENVFRCITKNLLNFSPNVDL